MNDVTKKRTTRLESSQIHEIAAVLDNKLELTDAMATADYMSLAVNNLESIITKISDEEKSLKSLKAKLKSQIETVKIGSAQWLESMGVSKLEGLTCSSITTFQPAVSEKLIIVNKESLINQGYFKTTLDETAVKEAIRNDVKVEGAEIELIHKEAYIKVNPRRP